MVGRASSRTEVVSGSGRAAMRSSSQPRCAGASSSSAPNLSSRTLAAAAVRHGSHDVAPFGVHGVQRLLDGAADQGLRQAVSTDVLPTAGAHHAVSAELTVAVAHHIGAARPQPAGVQERIALFQSSGLHRHDSQAMDRWMGLHPRDPVADVGRVLQCAPPRRNERGSHAEALSGRNPAGHAADELCALGCVHAHLHHRVVLARSGRHHLELHRAVPAVQPGDPPWKEVRIGGHAGLHGRVSRQRSTGRLYAPQQKRQAPACVPGDVRRERQLGRGPPRHHGAEGVQRVLPERVQRVARHSLQRRRRHVHLNTPAPEASVPDEGHRLWCGRADARDGARQRSHQLARDDDSRGVVLLLDHILRSDAALAGDTPQTGRQVRGLDVVWQDRLLVPCLQGTGWWSWCEGRGLRQALGQPCAKYGPEIGSQARKDRPELPPIVGVPWVPRLDDVGLRAGADVLLEHTPRSLDGDLGRLRRREVRASRTAGRRGPGVRQGDA